MRYKIFLAIFLDLIVGMNMLLTPQLGFGQEGVSPYSIETDLVDLDLQPGESWEYWIWMSNNVDREISVNISVAGKLVEFLDVENAELVVPASSEKGARVMVSVPARTQAGTYTGHIIIDSEGIVNTLPVSLKVGDGEVSLMDVNIDLFSDTLEVDDPLRFHASFYNLGTKAKLNAHLTYIVKDVGTGKVLAIEEDDIQFETSHSFEKIMYLDDLGVESGEYIVEMVAEYDGKEASSTGKFEVKEPFWGPDKAIAMSFLLLFGGTVSLKMYKRKKMEENGSDEE